MWRTRSRGDKRLPVSEASPSLVAISSYLQSVHFLSDLNTTHPVIVFLDCEKEDKDDEEGKNL